MSEDLVTMAAWLGFVFFVVFVAAILTIKVVLKRSREKNEGQSHQEQQ